MKNLSPLRYPGGKAAITGVLAKLIAENSLSKGVYVEPFAGGAGAALGLLQDGHVSRILINDADRRVYCIWASIMKRTEEFIERILNVELSIEEWGRQREIYRNPGRRPQLDIGFAAFYLNRCNRSGIMVNGGPIGGHSQNGDWKIDARFNRPELASRVADIASYEDRIILSNLDALDLLGKLERLCGKEKGLVYADPPYYVKGSSLYWSYYQHQDHVNLASALRSLPGVDWVLTYDNVEQIRQLYSGYPSISFTLRYSASRPKKGQEVMIFGSGVSFESLNDWKGIAV